VTHGVDAPARLIAERAGVGMGTIYRHFPTRPALVAAAGVNALHQYFVDRLVPVCDALLDAALEPEASGRVSGYMLMRGIGNLCIGGGNDPDYDAARLAGLLVTGVLTGAQ
jgi:AcrR family transcriptional regulator